MGEYKPPFHITEKMITLVAEISEQVGLIAGLQELGLVPENGRFRSRGVGIFDGDRLVHMAPPAEFVPEHIANLFAWYVESSLHPLIKSAIFHYEFEFIHPFMDGNGRMGRMWHSLLLGKWKEIFYWLPIEELIQSQQSEYYRALGVADKTADSAVFVELMLDIIKTSLAEVSVVGSATVQDTVQVSVQDGVQDAILENVKEKTHITKLLLVLGNNTLSATELMKDLGLSRRQTLRENYLNPALELGLIERTIPDKPNSRNQKYRRRK